MTLINRSHRQESKSEMPRVIPRGIFLLPSLLTLTNIYFGFYAIITSITHYMGPNRSRFMSLSAIFILVAACFDAMDGRIARLTKTTSHFGAQLDSIADIVSFGMAPGILVYCWALRGFHRFGWIPAFLFLASGAIRLARFNVLEDDFEITSKRYFIGLPIPAAAGMIAVMVLAKPDIEVPSFPAFIALIVVYVLAFLMVSRFKFRSFKDVDWKRPRSLGTLFFLLLFLIILLHEPVTILLILSIIYVCSGIFSHFMPEVMLAFFSKLDHFLLGVKILDDEDEPSVSITHEGEIDDVS